MSDPRSNGGPGEPDASSDADDLADEPTRLHSMIAEAERRRPVEPAAGAVVGGKYGLERLVARGGMGTIWDALDTDLERHVAIKFMDPKIAANEDLRQRFTREAKAVARLRTPHVVQIYEHGLFETVPYIVMELLEGEDLHARLKRQAPLPLDEAAVIVSQIAKGLRTAHEAGIIHRDLKPQNIFLARQDGDQVAKILDFGVAKMRASFAGFETRVGTVLGSPNYMAPEQARSAPQIDHRADVWSLGAIAFRAVTGKMAFPGEIAGAVIIKICAEPAPLPSRIRADLPPEMDAFFAKVFERDPDDRYQSAREAAEAFAAAVRVALGAMSTSEVGLTPQPSSGPEPARSGTPVPSPSAASPLPAAQAAAHPLAPAVEARRGGAPAPVGAGPSTAARSEAPEPDTQVTPSSKKARAESEGSGSHTPYTGPSVAAVTGPAPRGVDSSGQRIRPRRAPGRTAIVGGLIAGALLLAGVFALIRSGEQSSRRPPDTSPAAPIPTYFGDASASASATAASSAPAAAPSETAPSTAEPSASSSASSSPTASAKALSTSEPSADDAGTTGTSKRSHRKGPDWGY